VAHLTDMEELLATTPATPIRDYMREAMNCYMAGAYRGCIVLSYIALFDDLLGKLGELGKVNAAAKSVYSDAMKKKSDQDVFESYLIDQLSSKTLISGLDAAFLNTLRTLRNKSAHPSGHKPSPEESRFIFFETITRFLSRPILSTTQLVDEIVGRLNNANFFPTTISSDIKTIVEEEISSLHDEAIPQLIVKLIGSIVSADPTLAKNSGSFLIGLAQLDKASVNKELQSKVLTAKSDDPQYSPIVLQLLSANGKLIVGLSTVCMARVRQVLSKQIDDVTASVTESKLLHPTSTITSIAKHLDEAALLSNFKPELEKLFEKRPYSQNLLTTLVGRTGVFAIYFDIVLAKAGSSDFGTANAFASSVENIDAALSALVSDEQAFQLVVAVLKAANWGSFGAQDLRQAKFAGAPVLRAKATTHAMENTTAASAYLAEKLALAKSSEEFAAEYLTDVPDA
jgi:hypothetical protein